MKGTKINKKRPGLAQKKKNIYPFRWYLIRVKQNGFNLSKQKCLSLAKMKLACTNLKLSLGRMSMARLGVGRMIWWRPSLTTLSLSVVELLVDGGDILFTTTHLLSRIILGDVWPPSRILSMISAFNTSSIVCKITNNTFCHTYLLTYDNKTLRLTEIVFQKIAN